jgi:hypothetical protein
MAMPTIQKPQLDHVSFPWREQSDRFHMELDARRAEIFERSGFNKEFGNSDNALNTNEEPEGAAFILELSGNPFAGRGHQDGRRLQAGQQGHCDAEVDQEESVTHS